MRVFRLALAATVAAQAVTPALAFERCRVTDPTGTPLNVRDLNLKIVGTLDNGMIVDIRRDGTDPHGKAWAYVAKPDGDPIGWVYREFISCF
jgi:hypothetical protein